MYICNCNGISEGMLQTAVEGGAQTWTDVHAYFNYTPCCGKCSAELSNAIRTPRGASQTSTATLSLFKASALAGNI